MRDFYQVGIVLPETTYDALAEQYPFDLWEVEVNDGNIAFMFVEQVSDLDHPGLASRRESLIAEVAAVEQHLRDHVGADDYLFLHVGEFGEITHHGSRRDERYRLGVSLPITRNGRVLQVTGRGG